VCKVETARGELKVVPGTPVPTAPAPVPATGPVAPEPAVLRENAVAFEAEGTDGVTATNRDGGVGDGSITIASVPAVTVVTATATSRAAVAAVVGAADVRSRVRPMRARLERARAKPDAVATAPAPVPVPAPVPAPAEGGGPSDMRVIQCKSVRDSS